MLIKQRNAYYGIFQFTNNANVVVSCIRKKKRDYTISELSKYSKDQKMMWKALKTMIGTDDKNLTVKSVEFDLDVVVNKFKKFSMQSIQDVISSIDLPQNEWSMQCTIATARQNFNLLS